MNRRQFLLSLCALQAGVCLGQTVFAATPRVLVAFFSATGTTKDVAQTIAKAVHGDLYEIVPEKPYTQADLDWHDKSSRSSVEMADKKARPKIAGALPNFSQYDVVFLGYPIWWGIAPRIVETFVEASDLKGKTVIPFCTSGGSPFTGSANLLMKAQAQAKWQNGKRLKPGVQESDIVAWMKQFGF